jgi:signal transduction histidine kinase
VDELSLLVRHKLSNQGIRLVLDLQADLPFVLGDAPQLEQAFLNIILNAAEAMASGGVLTIRSRTSQTDNKNDRVVLEFNDTGVGMNEEQKQGAFKTMLVTTKRKGTGLGLAIVGRIIETHHGEIHVRSREGRGTTIRIWLSAK